MSNLIKSLLFIFIAMVAITLPARALAADCSSNTDQSTQQAIQGGVNSAATGDCTSSPKGDLDTTIKNIVNILSVLVGVVAVIMIIFAGFRFVASAGNAEGTKTARQAIIYAVIGLVVVALAQTITRFVLTESTSTSKIPSVAAPQDNPSVTSPSCPPGSNASCFTK